MRKTDLNRTTVGVVLVVTCAVILLGVLRSGEQAPGHGHGEHSHGEPHPGAALFQDAGCVRCHHAESRQTKMGPGLRGLFERERLPASGRPVTGENVRRQLKDPYKDMPSFADELDREQVERLIDYLKTL